MKAPASSSSSGLNLAELLKLINYQQAGQVTGEAEATPFAVPAAAERKAELASAEEFSKEGADHAGALASRFSAKCAKTPEAKG